MIPHLAPLLTLLAASAALAAAAPDGPGDPAARLLADVAERYRALKSYDVRGVTRAELNGPAFQNKVDVPMRFAGVRPDRLYSEVRNPNYAMVLIANKDSVWTYMPSAGQFMTQAAPEVIGEQAGPVPEQISRLLTPLADYTVIHERVRGARLLGRDTVHTALGVIECEKLEVEYQPDSTRPDLTEWPKVYWVDRARNVVLRDSSRTDVVNQQMGQVTTIQVTRYVVAAIDEGADDSLFRFVPPAGVRRYVEAEPPRSPLEGKPAPSFSLVGMDGKAVKLEALRGKVVLLDFWATWCGPCRRWMPIVQKVSAEKKAKGLVTYAVNLREVEAKIRPYLQQSAVTVPVLLDRDGAVGGLYGASAIPLTAIVDRKGNVARVLTGLHSEHQLREALKLVDL